MKKISQGRFLINHQWSKKEKKPDVGTTASTLRTVNQLLKSFNLAIQFEDSHYHNDDLTAKDSSVVEKQKRGFDVLETDTLITLHEIEDVFKYIKRTEDVKKLESIIKKHEEDKIKIDETIKHINSQIKDRMKDFS
mgnify:CR=1 FL=1|tara:strand:+ start:148 stop:555 length:408 start_codon:yes stop_codon:yes gene_type:complete